MKLNGRDIFDCTAPRSGVTIGNPVYEWIAAAHYGHLDFETFRGKPVEYQELIIAAYRTDAQTRAALAWINRPRRV